MYRNLIESVHAMYYARQNETLKEILKKILQPTMLWVSNFDKS